MLSILQGEFYNPVKADDCFWSLGTHLYGCLSYFISRTEGDLEVFLIGAFD